MIVETAKLGPIEDYFVSEDFAICWSFFQEEFCFHAQFRCISLRAFELSWALFADVCIKWERKSDESASSHVDVYDGSQVGVRSISCLTACWL